jgi:hypothetical protein
VKLIPKHRKEDMIRGHTLRSPRSDPELMICSSCGLLQRRDDDVLGARPQYPCPSVYPEVKKKIEQLPTKSFLLNHGWEPDEVSWAPDDNDQETSS